MLCLKRNQGQRIFVDDTHRTIIEVHRIEDRKVSLAFTAPKAVHITREEVANTPQRHEASEPGMLDAAAVLRTLHQLITAHHRRGNKASADAINEAKAMIFADQPTTRPK